MTDSRGLGRIVILRFGSESDAAAAIDLVASGEPAECSGLESTAANILTKILSTETADSTVLITYSVEDLDTAEEPEGFELAYYLSGDLVVAVEVTEASGNRDAVLTIAQGAFAPTS